MTLGENVSLPLAVFAGELEVAPDTLEMPDVLKLGFRKHPIL